MSNSRANPGRSDVWSRFWASGVPHSCFTTYQGDYAGTLGNFWRDAFRTLRCADTVLDIATGNAAIPKLLLATRPETSIECDAIDLARPAPAWLDAVPPEQRARLRLHGGVAAESLPFPDHSFAMVTSQYGIEYSDLDSSASEVLRVLRRGGRVRIVAHHVRSRPVGLAAHEIAHIDWLLQPDGMLNVVANLTEPMARAATPLGRASLNADRKANAARAAFNAMQDAISERIASQPCPDVLHEVRDHTAQVLGVAMKQGALVADKMLRSIRSQLADSRLRLDELRVHALDAEGARALANRVTLAGSQSSVLELYDEGHLFGWIISVDPQA